MLSLSPRTSHCSLVLDSLWELPDSLPTCVGMKYREGFKTLSRHNQWSCTLPSMVPTMSQEFFSFLSSLLSPPVTLG